MSRADDFSIEERFTALLAYLEELDARGGQDFEPMLARLTTHELLQKLDEVDSVDSVLALEVARELTVAKHLDEIAAGAARHTADDPVDPSWQAFEEAAAHGDPVAAEAAEEAEAAAEPMGRPPQQLLAIPLPPRNQQQLQQQQQQLLSQSLGPPANGGPLPQP